MRRRLLIAAAIGLVSGLLCYLYQLAFGRGAGDFGWALRLVPDLLAGRDPYAYPVTLTPMAYPLTAALVAAPFEIFPASIAAGVFFGLSSGLLAFGLTRDDQWWRLLVFLAFPYWHALQVVQWSPLLFAVALFPALLPLTLAKPHIGFPIAVTRLTWRRAIACALFGLLSLALLPDWPLRWLAHQAAPQEYLPPLVILPFGPLLLLALARWRDERARFLVILAAVPQRLFYDSFVLWLIPQTAREVLALVGLSWLMYICWFFWPAAGMEFMVLLLYLPALALVLRPYTFLKTRREIGSALVRD
jgi:hypothetical protein